MIGEGVPQLCQHGPQFCPLTGHEKKDRNHWISYNQNSQAARAQDEDPEASRAEPRDGERTAEAQGLREDPEAARGRVRRGKAEDIGLGKRDGRRWRRPAGAASRGHRDAQGGQQQLQGGRRQAEAAAAASASVVPPAASAAAAPPSASLPAVPASSTSVPAPPGSSSSSSSLPRLGGWAQGGAQTGRNSSTQRRGLPTADSDACRVVSVSSAT